MDNFESTFRLHQLILRFLKYILKFSQANRISIFAMGEKVHNVKLTQSVVFLLQKWVYSPRVKHPRRRITNKFPSSLPLNAKKMNLDKDNELTSTLPSKAAQ